MRIGDKITGTITGIKPYGAFVALDNGTEKGCEVLTLAPKELIVL